MTLQLRQICLVAEHLEPVIDDLTQIFGIQRCYVDPGVAAFGLKNTLMPLGRNFLEVVAPVKPNTAAGRYLERRSGNGGYMVITQADSKATQLAARARALDTSIRIAHETEREDWHLIQFHPGDLEAAFLEIETDAHNDFEGHWMPVGGGGWESAIDQSRTLDFVGVELQSHDPQALANKWAGVIGSTVIEDNGKRYLTLNNARLYFTAMQDDRGPGLSGLHITVADAAAIQETATLRGCKVGDDYVEVCGVNWFLHQHSLA